MYRNGSSSTNSGIPTTTTVRYLAKSVQPSLLRNGKVGTKRAPTGDDDVWFGNTIEDRKVLMHNARKNPNISLNIEGFELHKNDIPDEDLNSIDFWNFKDVVTRYKHTYSQWARKLKKVQKINFTKHFLAKFHFLQFQK